MGQIRIYLIKCSHCSCKQKTNTYKEKLKGNRRCYFCHRTFPLNKQTIIKEI